MKFNCMFDKITVSHPSPSRPIHVDILASAPLQWVNAFSMLHACRQARARAYLPIKVYETRCVCVGRVVVVCVK